MDARKRILLAGILAAVGTGLLVGCGSSGGGSNEVLATVNAETITRGDWYSRAALTTTAYPQYLLVRQQMGRDPVPVGYFCLDQLIGEKIIMQMAKKESAIASAAEIDEALTRLTRQNPKFLEGQQAFGRSRGMVKDDLKLQLTRFNLMTKGVKVSREEVDEYIKLHPEEFTVPAAIRYRLIGVVSEADKQKVDKELAGGTTFALVAKQYSKDASAKNEGMMPRQAISDLPPAVRSVVEAARVLSTTDWIPLGAQGWVKLYIEEKTDKQYKAPDEDGKWQLERSMKLRKAQDQVNFTDKVIDALNAAKIDIKEPWMSNIWKKEKAQRQEEMKRRKEQERTATPAGGASAPAGGGQP